MWFKIHVFATWVRYNTTFTKVCCWSFHLLQELMVLVVKPVLSVVTTEFSKDLGVMLTTT